MTEYEMGEMMHAQSAQMWTAAQMYFTLVSGYLIVGYLVGAKLTRAQASVISTLYLVWVIGTVIGQVTAGSTYMQLQMALSELDSLAVSNTGETPATLFAFWLFQFLGIVASLWFMWSVRHLNTE
jgi:hypothetical protein